MTPALNSILLERFEEISSRITKQSEIAEIISSDAQGCELIILFLVDGLSYGDIKHWPDVINANCELLPCLVDVPTLTRVAFPNVLGEPPIAERLFNQGYHSRHGFSYWTRKDNKLTDKLFRVINEVNKVGHFAHILSNLELNLSREIESKIYVQIMRMGLDGYAHFQKRHPPLTAVVEEIRNEFEQLIQLTLSKCNEFNWDASIYLTSDHGILWLYNTEPVVVGTAPSNSGARWSDWRHLYYQTERGRRFIVDGEEFYCLGFPKLRRPPRINEQGVHGGISYEESIVPFLKVRIES